MVWYGVWISGDTDMWCVSLRCEVGTMVSGCEVLMSMLIP